MSELMSRLVTTGKWPDGIPGGGIIKITSKDIAAACCGLPRVVYLYGLVKYTFDPGAVDELKTLGYQIAAEKAERKRWRVGEEQLKRLTDFVLEKAVFYGLCRACKGAGRHLNQKECKRCGGSGNAPEPSHRQKAKVVGVSHTSWRPHYEGKYQELLFDFYRFDDQIAHHLSRKIYPDER